ncbi:hypothetical protein [Chitinophaga cymbidii]|uniref:Lipoprotein n=1 Tax=Chitinophaga cymbidii TaxID=1096750 RepID=A0A512RQS3_9BACT|nr:hypothetical protein [Chitinophaga cymbidii]GEP98045.1 hypothetical protein CCY01nite_43050 [Chitinophaga cymbidii]
MKRPWLLTLVLCALAYSCKKDKDSSMETNINTSFSEGKQGWSAAFAEYSGNNPEIYEMEEGLAPLPAPLDETKQSYRISGSNRSDDLFMYLKRQVSGLQPNARYEAYFEVEIASSAPDSGVGAGGAPGEGVGVGIGMTVEEPVAAPDENNFYRMNIDKINQCCTDGTDMIVAGNLANGGSEYVYRLIKRTGTFSATADAEGKLWLIVGTDSGFEGVTTIYYTKINVRLKQLAQ